jgi:hypothetical protein
MKERGFSRYPWAHFYDKDPIDGIGRGATVLNLRGADGLVAGLMFHQYHAEGQKDLDIVTICTAPWRRIKQSTFRPHSLTPRTFHSHSSRNHQANQPDRRRIPRPPVVADHNSDIGHSTLGDPRRTTADWANDKFADRVALRPGLKILNR